MLTMKSEAQTDRLGNTVFSVTLTDPDTGKEEARTISMDDYISLLTGSRVEVLKYINIPSGFLPKGVREASLNSTRSYIVDWVVPGKKRPFYYGRGDKIAKRYVVPFPTLAFFLDVRDGYVRDKRVFALKEGDETLYQYPFGNVGSGGSICMGNIVDKELSESVDNFTDDFFSGVTNDDLWSKDNISVGSWTQPKLLEEASKLDVFPEKWLVRKDSYTPANLKVLDEMVRKASV